MENKKSMSELWREYKNYGAKCNMYNNYIQAITNAISFLADYASKNTKEWKKCGQLCKTLRNRRNYCYEIVFECNRKQRELLDEMQ